MHKITLVLIIIFVISSCSNNETVTNPITGEKPKPGIFSKDASKGVSLFQILNPENRGGISANVNGFLWRASLDTIDFMPLASVNYSGGIFVTDWYSNNESDENIKISIRFLTNEFRSDALDIKIFTKSCDSQNNCVTSEISGNLIAELKKEILKRAAQYKKENPDKKRNPNKEKNPDKIFG